MHLEMCKGTQGISGKIWPDGSFGYKLVKTKRYEDGKKIDVCEAAISVSLRQLREMQETLWRIKRILLITDEHLQFVLASCLTCSKAIAIGLSEATNYHKTPRSPRGAGGITGTARRRIRSAATLLEFRYGKDRMGFATLTMPNLSEEDRVACQENWCRVVQVFYQEMGREARRQGAEWLYVGCTEIQPMRSQSEGWNVPHIHFVFNAKVGKKWWITPKRLRTLWENAWRPHFSRDYSWQSSENLQRVRKSAAAYLSKYLSKGGALQSANSPTGSWFPSSWMSMNKPLKNWVAKACLSAQTIAPMVLEKEMMEAIFSRCGQRPVAATLSTGRSIIVGATGWISHSEWLDFLAAFWPEKLIFDPTC